MMKYKVEIAPLVDYYVIATKDKETGTLVEIFTLNESGTDMLKLFCQERDISTVAKKIAEIYEVPIEQVIKDVTSFANNLKQKGLLE